MNNQSYLINEDGTVTFFVSKLGVPSKIDGRTYNASEEVIDKFTKSNIGKIAGTFGRPDMSGLDTIVKILKRLEEKDPFKSIGIMVDVDLKADRPYLVVEPSKRLSKMIEEGAEMQLGLRSIISANYADPNAPVTVEKIISYDLIN